MSFFEKQIGKTAFVLICFLFFVSPAGAFSVTLKEKVPIQKTSIVLSDVAEVRDLEGDPILAKDPDAPFFISSTELQKRLRDATGSVTGRVFGRGTWVIPIEATLSEDSLNRFLESRISQQPEGSYLLERFRVRATINETLRIPVRKSDLVLRFPGNLQHLAEKPIRIAADILEPKNNHPSNPGERTLHRQFIEFRLIPREAVRSERSVRAPSVLPQKNQGLERSTVRIEAGSEVRLKLNRGSIWIEMKAIAQRAGREGEFIPVSPVFPSGKRADTIQGRILSDGSVAGKW